MFYCHSCAANCRGKMGSFTGLEAALGSVDFLNSPAVFLKCLRHHGERAAELENIGL